MVDSHVDVLIENQVPASKKLDGALGRVKPRLSWYQYSKSPIRPFLRSHRHDDLRLFEAYIISTSPLLKGHRTLTLELRKVRRELARINGTMDDIRKKAIEEVGEKLREDVLTALWYKAVRFPRLTSHGKRLRELIEILAAIGNGVERGTRELDRAGQELKHYDPSLDPRRIDLKAHNWTVIAETMRESAARLNRTKEGWMRFR